MTGEQEDVEFAEKHNLEKTAQALRDGMDWSFVMKRMIEESDTIDRLMTRIFKEKNSRIAYYLIKHADLTESQQVNIILFLTQEEDHFRLMDLVKNDLISGGVLSIIIEMVDDFDMLYHISLYANRKKLDVGLRNTIVDKIVKVDNFTKRKKFMRNVNWLSNSHKRKIFNA